jgi:AcrR family transcriptional regulator
MPAMPAPRALPVIQPQRPERVDAARNREAILCAARRLVAEERPASITMDRLAEAAGVGKGTLFRRFGDRASLFHALLDESERRLQEGFIRGPAPLGPGAPPRERLVAFGRALLELTAERGDILLAAIPATGALRFSTPVHLAYRGHLIAVLEGAEEPEPGYLADVLLAGLAPDLVLHQLREGSSLRELQERWQELVSRLLPIG